MRLGQTSNRGCDETNVFQNELERIQPDTILETPPDRLHLNSLQREEVVAGNRGQMRSDLGPSTRRANCLGHNFGTEEAIVASGGCQDQMMRDAEARRNLLSKHMHDVLEDPIEGRQNGVEASGDHIKLERSALQRLRDDPWRKKARDLSKENLVLIESLKRFQEINASKPKCCQLKLVKVC